MKCDDDISGQRDQGVWWDVQPSVFVFWLKIPLSQRSTRLSGKHDGLRVACDCLTLASPAGFTMHVSRLLAVTAAATEINYFLKSKQQNVTDHGSFFRNISAVGERDHNLKLSRGPTEGTWLTSFMLVTLPWQFISWHMWSRRFLAERESSTDPENASAQVMRKKEEVSEWLRG